MVVRTQGTQEQILAGLLDELKDEIISRQAYEQELLAELTEVKLALAQSRSEAENLRRRYVSLRYTHNDTVNSLKFKLAERIADTQKAPWKIVLWPVWFWHMVRRFIRKRRG